MRALLILFGIVTAALLAYRTSVHLEASPRTWREEMVEAAAYFGIPFGAWAAAAILSELAAIRTGLEKLTGSDRWLPDGRVVREDPPLLEALAAIRQNPPQP